MFPFTGTAVTGCRGCDGCSKAQQCVRATGKDGVNTWLQKTLEADCILLATPTPFCNVSVEMKSYIDRIGWICCRNHALKNKIGASIITCGTSGQVGALDAVCPFIISYFNFLHLNCIHYLDQPFLWNL